MTSLSLLAGRTVVQEGDLTLAFWEILHAFLLSADFFQNQPF